VSFCLILFHKVYFNVTSFRASFFIFFVWYLKKSWSLIGDFVLGRARFKIKWYKVGHVNKTLFWIKNSTWKVPNFKFIVWCLPRILCSIPTFLIYILLLCLYSYFNNHFKSFIYPKLELSPFKIFFQSISTITTIKTSHQIAHYPPINRFKHTPTHSHQSHS
jgi:hypothetical protein